MTDRQRIQALERALVEYVEKYGFTKTARDYFVENFNGNQQEVYKQTH